MSIEALVEIDRLKMMAGTLTFTEAFLVNSLNFFKKVHYSLFPGIQSSSFNTAARDSLHWSYYQRSVY